MSPLPGLNEPYPFRDAIVEVRTGFATKEFDIWLQQRVLPSIDAAPSQINVIADDDLNAAVALSQLIPAAEGGLYRFNYALQIMTADGVSSSAQVTLNWEFNGQSLSRAFTNINGNTVTTFATDPPFVFRATAGQPITYTVAYASNTPGAMIYSLTLSIELMRAI